MTLRCVSKIKYVLPVVHGYNVLVCIITDYMIKSRTETPSDPLGLPP
jgi:hypothetical protein